MRLLSLYDVATGAMEDLHLNDQNEAVWFMKKCQNAARRLKSWDNLKCKEVELQVDNEGRACLPHDFWRPLAISSCPGNYKAECNETNQANRTSIARPGGSLYYVDVPLLSRCGVNTGNWCGTSRGYSIDGNTLQIESRNLFVNVLYMGYNMNSEGQMLIQDEWEEYIQKYICAEYCLAYPQLKPQWVYQEYKKEWQALFRGIRSDATERQMANDRRQLSVLMNQFISRASFKLLN